jgi:hypothetical protein
MATYKPKQSRLAAGLTVNVTDRESRRLRKVARLEGLSFSAWAREVLIRAAERKAV